MKLFELSKEGFVYDSAASCGLVTYPTGGRSLVSLPLVSHTAMDIFVGNEVSSASPSMSKCGLKNSGQYFLVGWSKLPVCKQGRWFRAIRRVRCCLRVRFLA